MRDDLLERVVDELQTLPLVDEAAVGRIVVAAQADIAAVRGARPEVRRAWWQSRIPLAAAAGFALAAGIGGFLAGDAADRGPSQTAVAATGPASESLRFTSAQRAARSAQPAVVPTQFVLDAPRASRVALVGDFNGWNAATAPLVRDSSSGIWTVTVHLPPGRHVYAFMVDGKTWTLDPRAPTAPDPEFGTPSSVVLVGTP
ncbi:MAG: isoamylase early set domain-containing protein [Gemmatimonadaceae bacterium]